jgi:uncharacterized repeat protein (TIGR01451 family)
MTIDAGMWRPASLGNKVWEDLDHDGVQDPGEPGIAGVVVNLETPNGVISTTTDATGNYTFTDLLSSVPYTVTFQRPAGTEPTLSNGAVGDATNSDADPVTGVAPAVTLQPGENNPNIDAGFWRPASLGDTVWEDLNHDGVQDPGEPGIPGVVVTLTGPNGSLITTTTDATGNYSFTDLVSGAPYTVTFGRPVGFEPTIASGNVNDANNSDADPVTGATLPVTLQPGENNPNIDAGFWRPATLGSKVWFDGDRDGIQNDTEPGIPGVQVSLQTPTGTLTTTTDAGGYYTFTNLISNVPYTVTFQSPNGFQPSPQNANGSDDVNDSDADPVTGVAAAVTLQPGENNLNIDAGFWRPASLGDTVWYDLDKDGVQDPGERGIPGVTVTLQTPTGTITVVTDQNGNYLFTDLMSGVPYSVTFTAPPGYIGSPSLSNLNDSTNSDADPLSGLVANIVLGPDENNMNVDAGFYSGVAIGNHVWLDSDKDGQQDAGEAGVPGVVVTLFENGVPVSTTTTDANGNYRFLDVRPGVPYTLSFTTSGGLVWTTPGTEAGNESDSNVDGDGKTGVITLTPGQVNNTIDAGLISPIVLNKSAVGQGGGATIGPNNLITYTLSVRNTSAAIVSNIVVSDPLPSGVSYIEGSASPAATSTNPMVWRIASIPANSEVTVTFVVRVSGPIAASVRNVAYVAVADGTLISDQDDADMVARPTAVSLNDFAARWLNGGGAEVTWTTALELNTLGFTVYRSDLTTRDSAVKVSGQLIPAKGASGGAYRFVDTTAQPGVAYHYWLAETEIDGRVNEYGPVVISEQGITRAEPLQLAAQSPVLLTRVILEPQMALAAAGASDVNAVQSVVTTGAAPVGVSQPVAVADVAAASAPVAVAAEAVTVDGAPAPRVDVAGLQPAQTTAGAVAATDAQGQTPVVEPVESGERTTVSAVSGAARQTNAQKVESTAQPMLRLFAIGLTLFGLMLLVSVGGVAWLRRRSR